LFYRLLLSFIKVNPFNIIEKVEKRGGFSKWCESR
ncbi:hypothetical protein AZZ77_002365, partial [Klebsiella pneumoniae]